MKATQKEILKATSRKGEYKWDNSIDSVQDKKRLTMEYM